MFRSLLDYIREHGEVRSGFEYMYSDGVDEKVDNIIGSFCLIESLTASNSNQEKNKSKVRSVSCITSMSSLIMHDLCELFQAQSDVFALTCFFVLEKMLRNQSSLKSSSVKFLSRYFFKEANLLDQYRCLRINVINLLVTERSRTSFFGGWVRGSKAVS